MKTIAERQKRRNRFSHTIDATILAGIILLLIGLYYCIIKAGIPFQDPPLELQIQYAVHMGIGRILLKNGFVISLCGGIAHFLFKRIQKKSVSCKGEGQN